jgi:release factor glutamine methyltransferase
MMSQFTALLAELTGTLQTLPDKPEETADSTLRALWHAAAGSPKSAELAAITELPGLDASGEERVRHLLRRRLAGEPLAHLTGRQRFMGLEMLAGPEALVPRKETELLGGAAVALARELSKQSIALTVLDVCTGAGNVALTIASSVPDARVFGADISDEAVGLARRNAVQLGLAGRVEFRSGDLLAPFDTMEFAQAVDLITCNPPYISSARVDILPAEIGRREPRLAFDGGPFGVSILLRLLQDAQRMLRKGGYVVFEIGLGQGPALLKRIQKMGCYSEIRSVPDGNGAIRVLAACLR